jgi:hypothetical protein
MKNLFGRKALSSSRDRRSRSAAARRARLTPALDWLEDRQLLAASVSNLAITAIYASSDGDQGVEKHVSVHAGDTVTVDISYDTTGGTHDSNRHVEIWANDFSGSALRTGVDNGVQDEADGNHTGSISVGTGGLAPGTYGIKVLVTHQGNDTETQSSAVEVLSLSITVSPAVTVTAPDSVYDGAKYDETIASTVRDGATDVSGFGTKTTLYYSSLADATSGANAIVAPTDAGTYWVRVSFNSDGLDHGGKTYTDAFGVDSFTIAKADAKPVVSYTGSGTYDGKVQTQTVTVTGVGGVVLYSESLSGTNAGSYSKGWSFSNDNYAGLSGTLAFAIAKATATFEVSGYGGTYDGQAHGATVTATGVNGEDLSSLLDPGDSFTNAPGGTANWSFAGNQNYEVGGGSVAIVIAKADATPAVSGYTGGTYDGSEHTRTVTVTGVGGVVLYSDSLSGTNAGGYSKVWSFSDVNYNDLGGTLAFAIAKADAVLNVNGYGGTYDGQAHGLTGTATGVNGEDLSGLLHLGSTYTKVGSYSVSWSFTGNQNYNEASGTKTVAITYASLDGFSSASVQAALDLSKQGTVSFAIRLDESGMVDGQSTFDLFNGAEFTLSMDGGADRFYATSTVVGNVVYVNINLKSNQTFYNFLAQGLDSGETSASRASWESITLSAESNGGNYKISDDVLTRIFKSTK